MKSVIIGVLIAGGAACCRAEVKVVGLFGDGMVLQQEMPIKIWGEAAPKEAVTVTFADTTAETVADAHGRWQVKLAAMPASAQPRDLNVMGKLGSALSRQCYTNVVVGEVWVCSGQSNMDFSNRGTLLTNVLAKVCAEANYPQLRTLRIPNAKAQVPQSNVTGCFWQVCSPVTARSISATAYFFGRDLHRALKVPVGLIVSAVSGTPSESWTSVPALEKDPDYPPIAARWEKLLAAYPAALQHYEQVTIPKWEKAVAAAKTKGTKTPRRPGKPWGPESSARPGNLFNGMITPLTQYAVRGVIWYQGESNADDMERALQYYTLFPTLIKDWRMHWGRDDLPFLFVQLANFKAPQTNAVEASGAWPVLREAQAKTLALPNTGMAVAIDVMTEEFNNIHPRNKQEVGRRLSLVAQAQVYGRKIPCYGPMYDGMEIKSDKVVIRFKYTEGGLVVRAREGQSKLTGFAIAGKDGKFGWAHAEVRGGTVVVSSPDVPVPVTVRYGWAVNPIGNLYNGAGLPTAPFRTDTETKLCSAPKTQPESDGKGK